jgi:glycosyltransferase involved in cell wall biosynthesis
MSKRILISAFTFPPQRNGVSHVVEAHATGLARLGHDVTVVTGWDPSREGDMWHGVKIRQFATQGNGRWIRGGYAGDVCGYQDYIASFTGDIIICHCWQIWSTDLAVEVFDRLRCAKVLVSHGVSARQPRKSLKGLLNRLMWIPYVNKMPGMMRKFDHVVLLSDRSDPWAFYDRSLMARIGFQHFSVIPNGAYLDRWAAAEASAARFRTLHGIGERPMVLNVSNYSREKNQRMVLRAFLDAALPDAVLVFIGSELNEYARGVQSLARQAGAAGQRVVLLEKQTAEDTVAAYCAADLFVSCSEWEIQPLVILEAIAAGTPFVSTNVGCVRDIPGGVTVRNLTEMIAAVRLLMADESRRRQLGREGQAAVRERFTWEKIVRQYDALITRLCSNRDTQE